jgi:DNA-binding MarR family transcriptional regulator
MIERRSDPADRRAWQLHLTDKSRKVDGQLQQKVDSLVDDMLAGLSADERAEFSRLLTAVGENLSERRETARISHG